MPGLVARADRRPGVPVRILLLGLLVSLLTACTPAGQQPIPPRSPAPESPVRTAAVGAAEAQRTLDLLSQAVLRQDRGAFDRQIADRDPSFPRSAGMIYDNLTASPLTDLSFRLRSPDYQLTDPRRALLGPQAVARQVAVRWRLRGDVGRAEHLLWLTFRPGSGASQIAGTTDGPGQRTAQPIWLVQPIRAGRVGATTVLASDAGTVGDWLRRGNAAVAAVRPRLPSLRDDRWNQHLVIEVPASRQQFERVLGVAAGSYAQIAAVAWPEGPDAATAAIRILVNPEQAGRLDEQGIAILLAHEAVHVATRSAASAAPTWLVEGLADYVAYDAYPRTARTAAAALLTSVKTDGAPASLPADAEFSPSAGRLPLVYAEAWTACRLLAETHTRARLIHFYADVSSGAEVDQAFRSAFGLDLAAFTDRWRRHLESTARKG